MFSLFLIRHGQTRGNQLHKYVGRTDECLAEGERTRLAQLISPQCEQIFVSPLCRARETAAVFWPRQGVTVVDDLRECDFGVFEYKSYDELRNDDAYCRWLASGGWGEIPSGESGAVFRARTAAAFAAIVTVNCSDLRWRRAALVAHGGTIMSILSAFYGGDFYQWQVACGEGFLVEIDERLWLEQKRLYRASKWECERRW